MFANEHSDVGSKLMHNFWGISHILHQLCDGRGSQKRILTILLRHGPVTQSALTEHLGIQPGSASEVLSKLESAGFIFKSESAADRRTVNIELTDSGRAKAELALSEREQLKGKMLAPLSQEEQAELLALLEKVNTSWNERYGEQGERGKHRE
jgi:DNA-binding MarR family transcriptional regulator